MIVIIRIIITLVLMSIWASIFYKAGKINGKLEATNDSKYIIEMVEEDKILKNLKNEVKE